MTRAAVLAAAGIVFAWLFPVSGSEKTYHLDLRRSEGVSVASLDYLGDVPKQKAEGILVLLPGYNGNGAKMLLEPKWRNFARENNLILGAFTFVSDPDLLREGGGYYDTAKCSGDAAVDALRRIGGGKLPVFIYGFSGGAHFAANFAESHPRAVRGWCAASFDEKNRAKPKIDNVKNRPPGIVACGTADSRIDSARNYYFKGRKAERKWTWLEVPGLAHARSDAVESFARNYFIALLNRKEKGVWIDTGSRKDISYSSESAQNKMTWLPDAGLADEWRRLTGEKSKGIIEHVVKIKNSDDMKKLSLFLRLPESLPPGANPKGVLCLCLLANNPEEVREKIRGEGDRIKDDIAFAERNSFAIVAWGAKQLWDPDKNWNELSKPDRRRIDRDLDLVARAWDSGLVQLSQRYGIPQSAFLIKGFSGSAQYAMRLAARLPKRFLAIHAHIPSSFDEPFKEGSSLLWCVTTGENEMGYERSLAFFRAARDAGYPIIYKAYPGLGHVRDSRASALGYECFEFALETAAKVPLDMNGVRPPPDWKRVFAESGYIADVCNQRVRGAAGASRVPRAFRMPIPSAGIKDLWCTD